MQAGESGPIRAMRRSKSPTSRRARPQERLSPACRFPAGVGPVALALRALVLCVACERLEVGAALREAPPPDEARAAVFFPPPLRLLVAVFRLLMRATDRLRTRGFRTPCVGTRAERHAPANPREWTRTESDYVERRDSARMRGDRIRVGRAAFGLSALNSQLPPPPYPFNGQPERCGRLRYWFAVASSV